MVSPGVCPPGQERGVSVHEVESIRVFLDVASVFELCELRFHLRICSLALVLATRRSFNGGHSLGDLLQCPRGRIIRCLAGQRDAHPAEHNMSTGVCEGENDVAIRISVHGVGKRGRRSGGFVALGFSFVRALAVDHPRVHRLVARARCVLPQRKFVLVAWRQATYRGCRVAFNVAQETLVVSYCVRPASQTDCATVLQVNSVGIALNIA